MKDFNLAFAKERLARAYAKTGGRGRALGHFQLAVILVTSIAGPVDNKVIRKIFAV